MRRQEIEKLLKSKDVIIDVHTHIGISPKFYYQFGYPYALSFEDLAIRMKVLGIDYSVVFPFVDSAYYEIDITSSKIKTTTKFCKFPYELENRNLLNEINEIFPEYSSNALPFFMFDPSREPEKQVAHMEELSEKYPVFGLKTVTTDIQSFENRKECKIAITTANASGVGGNRRSKTMEDSDFIEWLELSVQQSGLMLPQKRFMSIKIAEEK